MHDALCDSVHIFVVIVVVSNSCLGLPDFWIGQKAQQKLKVMLGVGFFFFVFYFDVHQVCMYVCVYSKRT